jgi:hypothetical protein
MGNKGLGLLAFALPPSLSISMGPLAKERRMDNKPRTHCNQRLPEWRIEQPH